MNDAQLTKLESIHERSGVGESLGLNGGRRLKLSGGRPPTNIKPTDQPDFDFDFTKSTGQHSNEEQKQERSDSEELPDVEKVLIAMDQRDQVIVEDKSSDSYSDSEMDAFMMTIDSNGGLVDNFHHSSKGDTCKGQPARTDARQKRKFDFGRSDLSSPGCRPPIKRSRLTSDPLFLRGSSPSSPPVRVFNEGQGGTGGAVSGDSATQGLEDFFALDETLFQDEPSTALSESEPLGTSSTVAPNANIHKDEHTIHSKDQTQPSNTDAKDEQDTAYDFLADLEDWIENSGCVRIVDSLD